LRPRPGPRAAGGHGLWHDLSEYHTFGPLARAAVLALGLLLVYVSGAALFELIEALRRWSYLPPGASDALIVVMCVFLVLVVPCSVLLSALTVVNVRRLLGVGRR
jgi:hypothetical protein